ncbi:MAG TPA: phosphatidylinositol mannoside acyltransferase [Actinomycetota bacterium]|nr:phosphatidylinositol mannoside acyltransferase [Actinomycetota bacterium]
MSLREDGLRLTAVYWTYRTLENAATWLPGRLGRRLTRALGGLAYRTLPGVRATVAANQARVLGEPVGSPLVGSATREAFALYARFWYDAFRIRALAPEEIVRRTRLEGLEHIEAALADGKGCIAAIPHMGNWDVAGAVMAASGIKIAAVAEVLEPPRLAELFVRHREELGMRIVPLAEGAHVGQQLARLLSEDWLVALVADRDLSGRGIEVEMFGGSRRLPAGPGLLAVTSGAALVVCSSNTTDDGWIVRIGAPLEIPRTGDTRADATALTWRIAAEFERAISANPPDWHLFQPAWPS